MITDFTGEFAFLSNFAETPFSLHRGTWPTAEHAFQAFKSLDLAYQIRVAGLPTPSAAKRAGRCVRLRDDWETVKKRVMLDVVMAKFTQNRALAAALTATGHQALREGNMWHDNYWGDCRCGRPACVASGDNYLGQILMAVRLVLREDG